MFKIEMLDNGEGAREVCDVVHECIGEDVEQCFAVCDDCGYQATPDQPVYIWRSKTVGIDCFVCGLCLDLDDYTQLVEV